MVKIWFAILFLSLLCVSGTLMGDPVVMLSLYPEFPQAVMSSVASCGEFVFLLDRSGSMDSPMNHRKNQQTRIGSARVFIMCNTITLFFSLLFIACVIKAFIVSLSHSGHHYIFSLPLRILCFSFWRAYQWAAFSTSTVLGPAMNTSFRKSLTPVTQANKFVPVFTDNHGNFQDLRSSWV